MTTATTIVPGFARVVVAPVLLGFFVTLALMSGFVKLAIDETDAGALQRQTDLLQRALDERILQSTRSQIDLAAWDEAVLAHARGDRNWFRQNLGADGYTYNVQNRIYILNPNQTPFFAMQDGHEQPAIAFESLRDQVAPLVERLLAVDTQSIVAAYKADARNAPPAITSVALVEGHPVIINVAPLVSDTLEFNAPPGLEPIYISVTMLDALAANALSEQYLLSGARFDDDGTVVPPEVAIAINNVAGQPTVWFKWLPDRPGKRLMSGTLPALILGLVVLAIIIAMMLRNMYQAAVRLQAERADADYRALHDPLTGLGNRALFNNRLEQAFAAMPRHAPHLALLALDLDRFKQVNDALGHEAGDELLRQVSARITNILRPTDTLVRLGGDEFAIIQSAIADASDPSALASRVISAVSAPFHLGDKVVEVGVSIGIVTAPDHAQTRDELVGRADNALYQAKAGGRNRYCFYAQSASGPQAAAELEQRVHLAMSRRSAV